MVRPRYRVSGSGQGVVVVVVVVVTGCRVPAFMCTTAKATPHPDTIRLFITVLPQSVGCLGIHLLLPRRIVRITLQSAFTLRGLSRYGFHCVSASETLECGVRGSFSQKCTP
ncbi:hypothetical protein B0H66DRAFT_544568 [Apodospora peruviana]|uniref:Uncharacterized protein n=1 Tax=Apodospora peruviana TaxID=516989 RepID=A0AAE0ISX4_9PEZI|nr:hypothetical protein B0H66DRAFT_544568 [Apodospora peruviana]